MRLFRARPGSTRGVWLIISAAVLWGTVGPTTQSLYALTTTNALSIGFFRLAFALPLLALACWRLLGRRSLDLPRRDLLLIAGLGALVAAYQVFYFAAIARAGVAVAALVTLCLAPVIVALVSAGILRERLTRATLLALGLALLGTALLIDLRAASDGAALLVGVLLALGSAAGYALITLCGRALAGRCHPLQTTTLGFATASVLLLPFALGTGFVISYPAEGWGLLVYLGCVPTAIAYALFLRGMHTTTATAASTITLLEPLTATLLAMVLFHERLGPLGVVGGALLLGAVAVLAREGKEMPMTGE